MFETNGLYAISYFSSVKAKEAYKKAVETESDFIQLLANPANTQKSDTALFVGGVTAVVSGKRTCLKRAVIVLDADHPKADFLQRAEAILSVGDYSYGTSWGWYTSASATKEQPRYRIVILPDSEILIPEDYRKICSAIMADIAPGDITAAAEDREFDWSSAEFSRLMYMPTNPNGYYNYKWHNGTPLNVADLEDWISAFDYSAAFAVHGNKVGNKAVLGEGKTASYCCYGGSFSAPLGVQDPREKDSIIGSFCKVFNVEEAIEAFDLPYSQAGERWIYDGSSSGMPGVSISDCGNFLLSVHESDPAGGRLQNAYDLVRIHKQLDNRAMYKLAMQNPDVKQIENERAAAYKARTA